jgi:hypothetical protein
MATIVTKEFFNNGKTGNNGLFNLYFSEGEDRGQTLDDFTKKFLPLVGDEFEVLTKRLRYHEKEQRVEDYQLVRYYGSKIIKTPNRIAQEMHVVMTKHLKKGGKKFRDGKINSWYYVDEKKCVYVVRCYWVREKWLCTCHFTLLGGPYGNHTRIRIFYKYYLGY